MKTLYLIRGVSGSGKSTFAFEISQAMDIDYVEADAFCYNDKDEYDWQPSKLKVNHKKCQEYAVKKLENGESVIVSNTTTTLKELNIYKDIAEKYDAKFVSLVVENYHHTGNTHNVPDNVLEKQKTNLLSNINL